MTRWWLLWLTVVLLIVGSLTHSNLVFLLGLLMGVLVAGHYWGWGGGGGYG